MTIYEENRIKRINEMSAFIKLLSLFFASISVFSLTSFRKLGLASLLVIKEMEGKFIFFAMGLMLLFVYQGWRFINKVEVKFEKPDIGDIMEMFVMLILFTYLVYSTHELTQYRFLYFFLILSTTIRFGMNWGLGVAGLCTLCILIMDFSKTIPGKVNYIFQADFILAGVFLLTAWLIGYYAEIEKEHREKMHDLINMDELTGIYNHRYFQEYLATNLDRAGKNEESLSLLFIDIDNFKYYNDMYGHSYGDKVLKIMGSIFHKTVGEQGIAARYGGEEFVVVLPDMAEKQALGIGGKIRKKVEETSFEGEEHQPGGKLTVSIGISSYPVKAMTKQELIETADDALYRAKSFSRNRVELYFSVLEELKKDIDGKHVDLVSSIKTLIGIINAKDKYTYGHTERVVLYCSKFAKFLGLSTEEKKILRYGAYLHDIGKIEIPAETLVKRSKLTEEEFQALRKHPENGANIIEGVETLSEVVPLIKLHHEKYDGTGYPNGLMGEDIPRLVRIITLMDSFDAMTTNRSYCRGKTYDEALEEMKRCKGTHFDPELVESFIEMLEKNKNILNSMDVLK